MPPNNVNIQKKREKNKFLTLIYVNILIVVEVV